MPPLLLSFLRTNEQASSEGGSQVHALFKVGSKSGKPFCVTVLVNGIDLSMEIDTGAAFP